MSRANQRHTKNSTLGAVLAFENKEVSIPSTIQVMFDLDGFTPLWNNITSCRTPDNWKDWELVECAEICREQLEIAELEAELQEEGKVITFPNGAVSTNPKWKMIQDLKKSYMSRIRLIGIHDVKQQARGNGSVAVKDIPDQGADLI
jgi:hypothetical protein